MKRIRCDQIITPEGILDGFIYHENGKIVEVSKKELPFDEEYDATGNIVAPGFIEMHTHGGGGFPFEGSVEDVIEGTLFHLRHGVFTTAYVAFP